MGKIIPIILALIGLGGGVGAGMFLRPPPEVVEINPCGDPTEIHTKDEETEGEESAGAQVEFVKLNNQFVVPIVDNDKVTGMVVMSLSLGVSAGNTELVYEREPKLRDEFLQVMFNHANSGGFSGAFTQTGRMTNLRRALSEVAISILGEVVDDVLVTNILRQDQE